MFPVPGDLMRVASSHQDLTEQSYSVGRLTPGPTSTGRSGKVLRPLTANDSTTDSKPLSGFITLDGLKAYLTGSLPGNNALVSASKLFGFESRTGIVIYPDTLVAEDSNIYSTRMLRLERDVSFYAEVSADAPIREGAIHFGGEGRHVLVEKVQRVDWPVAKPSTGNAKRLWYLASPGLFGGWRLPGDESASIVSAAVGNPLAISGWDNARNCPRPNRYAAPAGSVYYTDQVGDSSDPQSFGDTTEEGFGFALPGIWKDITQ